jgi:hypothetical protein
MSEPVRASQVELKDERTEDEKRRQVARQTVQGIFARRAALRKAGGAIEQGSPTNLGTIQERLARRDRERYDKFREDQS